MNRFFKHVFVNFCFGVLCWGFTNSIEAQQMNNERFLLNIRNDDNTQTLRNEAAANFDVISFLMATDGAVNISGRKSNNEEVEYYQYDPATAKGDVDCNYFCKVITSEKERSFFGVSIEGSLDFEGVVVNKVIEHSVAHTAGFLPGDILTEVNAEELRSTCDFTSLLAMYEPGEIITIQYIRDRITQQVDIQLGHRIVRHVSWEQCCEEPTEFVVDNNLGIQELHIQELNIFPNPGEGLFNVSFKSDSHTALNIDVVDAGGKNVFSQTINQFDGLFNDQIDITKQAAGVYFLRIQQDGKQFIKQLIIQKK